MSSKSSKAPGSGGKPEKRDDRIRVPLSVPVKIRRAGEDDPEEIRELRLGRLEVGHLKAAPLDKLKMGHLLDVGLRVAGIEAPADSAQSSRVLFRKVPIADLGPLIDLVESGLGEYHASAAGYDLDGIDTTKAHTVKLTTAASFAGETISELVLAPLTTGHLWDSPAGEGMTIYETVHLGGRQAGVSSAVVDGLGMVDAGRVAAAVTAFLLGFRAIGLEP